CARDGNYVRYFDVW
nr:immunoglobulin heavy chain junction region [Mus musculus]